MAFCSAIPTIPMSIGVPRILHGNAVPYLLGDPALPPEREYALRERLTAKALSLLMLEVTEPTLVSLV